MLGLKTSRWRCYASKLRALQARFVPVLAQNPLGKGSGSFGEARRKHPRIRRDGRANVVGNVLHLAPSMQMLSVMLMNRLEHEDWKI